MGKSTSNLSNLADTFSLSSLTNASSLFKGRGVSSLSSLIL